MAAKTRRNESESINIGMYHQRGGGMAANIGSESVSVWRKMRIDKNQTIMQNFPPQASWRLSSSVNLRHQRQPL